MRKTHIIRFWSFIFNHTEIHGLYEKHRNQNPGNTAVLAGGTLSFTIIFMSENVKYITLCNSFKILEEIKKNCIFFSTYSLRDLTKYKVSFFPTQSVIATLLLALTGTYVREESSRTLLWVSHQGQVKFKSLYFSLEWDVPVLFPWACITDPICLPFSMQ